MYIWYIHSFFHCFSLPSCHSQVVQHWRQDEGQDTNDHQQLLLGLGLDHLHQNHWLNGFRFFGQTSWHLQYPSNPSPKAFVMMSKPPKSLKLPWTKKQSASGNHSLHFNAFCTCSPQWCPLSHLIPLITKHDPSASCPLLARPLQASQASRVTAAPLWASIISTMVNAPRRKNTTWFRSQLRTLKCVKLKDAFWTVSNNSVLNHSTDFFKKSPAHRLRDIFQSLLDGSIKVGRRHIHSGADQGPNQDLEKEWSPQFHVLGYQFWKIRNWPFKL